MRGQIGGLAQAQRNAQDGISMVQTAEGALTEVHSMLQRVRDLKVQYNNGTNSADDKVAIAAEVAQIAQEVSDIVGDTKFNGTAVFNNGTFSFQVGANDSETVSTSAANLSGAIAAGGLSGLTNITDAAGASQAPRRRRQPGEPRPRSTTRSRTCRRSAPTSARCRTASSIA